MNERQDWNSFFMDMAFFWAQRSTCTRRKVGAVAVKDKRVIASGYNGAAKGYKHCTPDTCLRTVQNIPSGQRLDICRAIHAEQNLILQAAQTGIQLPGCSVYCTTMPCHTCLKLLFNTGVSVIYFAGNYDFDAIKETLEDEHNKPIDNRCRVYQMTNEAEKGEVSIWVPSIL